MQLNEILYAGEYYPEICIDGITVESIATKVENIRERTLFVILRSLSFDVNNLTDPVLDKNPAAIICDTELFVRSTDIPIIRVNDTRALLPYLYSRFYHLDLNKIRFCGITGTNGKTTTATILTKILIKNGMRVGFIGTGNIHINGEKLSDNTYSMTTPDPDMLYSIIKKMQDSECEIIVMEVSSHSLFLKKVAPILFEVSVFTNLSPEHLDLHKSMEEYFQTKMKLFEQSKRGVFNMDDEFSKRAYEMFCGEKTSIGIINSADAVARELSMNGLLGSEYYYKEAHRIFRVQLKLGGGYNVYNSMLAIAAAIQLGVTPCVAKAAIKEIEAVDGRLEIIQDSVTVIIDYAHTEQAMTNVLKAINAAKNSGQKIYSVFGCGGERDASKRPKMARAAEMNSDFVIVTNDNPRNENEEDIIRDILTGFESTERRTVITSRESAIRHAIEMARDGDIIAIIGKGHERYNINKNGYTPFDEREIIRDALNKRRLRSTYENKN